jgi:aspartate-semialdehyde dehydrogenase
MRIAIVGATGAVGREMIGQLEASTLANADVVLVASERSAGQTIDVRGEPHTVRALTADCFDEVDLALFSCGGSRSQTWAPIAVERGAVVVDNSSAWRLDPTVPLVVPEVNRAALRDHLGIIANPNCSTIQLVLPLRALAESVGIRRVIVATYQSASGAGQSGRDELWAGLRAATAGEPVPSHVFPHPLALDVIPQIGEFRGDGYTTEEQKMLDETRKILGLPELAVSATCVRVPVDRSHLEAVTVDCARPIGAAEARALFAAMPGVEVLDVPEEARYPMARDATGRRETFVGRVREDSCLPGTLHFWVVSDNLLKGAAWNAVQIAEALHEEDLVQPRR